jgi:hypothetical protein
VERRERLSSQQRESGNERDVGFVEQHRVERAKRLGDASDGERGADIVPAGRLTLVERGGAEADERIGEGWGRSLRGTGEALGERGHARRGSGGRAGEGGTGEEEGEQKAAHRASHREAAMPPPADAATNSTTRMSALIDRALTAASSGPASSVEISSAATVWGSRPLETTRIRFGV